MQVRADGGHNPATQLKSSSFKKKERLLSAFSHQNNRVLPLTLFSHWFSAATNPGTQVVAMHLLASDPCWAIFSTCRKRASGNSIPYQPQMLLCKFFSGLTTAQRFPVSTCWLARHITCTAWAQKPTYFGPWDLHKRHPCQKLCYSYCCFF